MAITVARLPTTILVGHSNGDGFGGTTDLFRDYPHLAPTVSPGVNPEQDYWKNIYVFTSALPWPEEFHTPAPQTTPGEGDWLEMTVSNPESDADLHPHPSPYRYPNNRGAAYPNWMHNASPHGGGTFHGVEIPHMWRMSHHHGTEVGLIKHTFSSSLFLRYDPGADANTWLDAFGYSGTSPSTAEYVRTAVNPADGYYGWWSPSAQFDFAPSTNRLYGSLLQKCVGAAAALPAGSKLGIRRIIVWMLENDVYLRDATAMVSLKEDCKRFIRRFRQDCVDNDWTDVPRDQIQVIWMKPNAIYNGDADNHPLSHTILDEIAADDPFVRVLDTDDYEMASDLGYNYAPISSATHFSHNAYVVAEQAIYDAILEMEVDPFDALAEDERITVLSMKNRVRLYYSRSRSNTDIKDEILLQHLNGAMFHVLNQCGDYAWFLKHRMNVSVTGGGVNSPITLPKHVHRLLTVEDPTNASLPLQFELIGHTEGGKPQIILLGRSSGTYTMRFIRMPRELEMDTELMPIPFQLVEWIVVETCYRLARAASLPSVLLSYQNEAALLREDVLKNMSAMQRGKRDRIYTQRRMPNIFRRGRRWELP